MRTPTRRSSSSPRNSDEDPDEPAWDLYSACVYILAACMTEPEDAQQEDVT